MPSRRTDRPGAAAALFLASVLLHALAHAVVGRRLGVGIGRITLFVFGSGPIGGLWLALIGWFLGNAARQSWQGRLVEDRLGTLPVSRVMHHDYREIRADMRVQELVDQGFLALSYRAYPVVGEGELQGPVSLADVRGLDRAQWSGTR